MKLVLQIFIIFAEILSCNQTNIVIPDINQANSIDIEIIDKPVLLSEYRSQLTREYSLMHYGEPLETIIPKAIIIHWTASCCDWQPIYHYFYGEELDPARNQENGKLNVTAHFLVARDGTIYRLTPETMLNRHAIGLNWCSIGIENIGGENGNQNLTEEQLISNTKLVFYLTEKYSTINYLLGHYQQDYTKEEDLWIELVDGYYAGKQDPGPIFMERLIENVREMELITFPL